MGLRMSSSGKFSDVGAWPLEDSEYLINAKATNPSSSHSLSRLFCLCLYDLTLNLKRLFCNLFWNLSQSLYVCLQAWLSFEEVMSLCCWAAHVQSCFACNCAVTLLHTQGKLQTNQIRKWLIPIPLSIQCALPWFGSHAWCFASSPQIPFKDCPNS